MLNSPLLGRVMSAQFEIHPQALIRSSPAVQNSVLRLVLRLHFNQPSCLAGIDN